MARQKQNKSSKTQVVVKPIAQPSLQLQSSDSKVKNTHVGTLQKGQEKMSVVAKTKIETTQSDSAMESVEMKNDVKSAPRLVADADVIKSNDASSKASAAVNATSGLISAGTSALSEIVSASSSQAQKAQGKAVAIARESADHMSRSAQAATRSFDEVISISHEQIEAIMQHSNLLGETARKMMDELFSCTNDAFARNVEMSRDIFSCRTINDAVDLQNKFIQSNVDCWLHEASKISEIAFEFATQAVDPIGERVSEAMERLTKSIAA